MIVSLPERHALLHRWYRSRKRYSPHNYVHAFRTLLCSAQCNRNAFPRACRCAENESLWHQLYALELIRIDRLTFTSGYVCRIILSGSFSFDSLSAIIPSIAVNRHKHNRWGRCRKSDGYTRWFIRRMRPTSCLWQRTDEMVNKRRTNAEPHWRACVVFYCRVEITPTPASAKSVKRVTTQSNSVIYAILKKHWMKTSLHNCKENI